MWYLNNEDIKNTTQIDLILNRKDNVVNLCEIKYTNTLFEINKKYEEELLNKISIFKEVTKTNKSIILTFITYNGLVKNNHYNIVKKELLANDLFR